MIRLSPTERPSGPQRSGLVVIGRREVDDACSAAIGHQLTGADQP